MKKVLVALLMLAAGAHIGWGKTVGVWKVAPHHVTDAIVKTLDQGGWRVVTIGNTNLADGAVLADLDVLFLPGGWDVYRFAGFQARRNLVKFVAGGKGLLDSSRNTAKFPLFPQVGTTAGHGIGQLISPIGTNELAKLIGEPFSLNDSRYLGVKEGAGGRLFAAIGSVPVGVHGEAYGGRYVLFGGSFGAMNVDTNALLGGTAQQLFLACLDWLASAPKLDAAERSRLQTQADLEFLRMEKRCDWTQTENLWFGNLSLVPEMRSRIALPVEKRLFLLSELSRSLSDGNLDRCRALTNEIRQTMAQLEIRYQEVRSNAESRIRQMELPELTEDNPFVNAAGVLKRIEAMPGKSEKEKAEIIALVNRCASDNPPLDASLSVALYLHGREIADQLLPAQRLSEMTNRFDKAIAELRATLPAPPAVAAGTVEERLRTDPLMMPYYTGNILPTPQKVEYKDEFLPMGKVAIVVGKDVADPGAFVDVLTDRIARYGGQAAAAAAPGAEHTAVVSLGDTEWARQAQGSPGVPERNEGYIVYMTKAGGKPLIILKGRDRLGLTWSIASLMQLIHWRDGRTMARVATVEDYPILPRRGMILDGPSFFHPTGDRNGNNLSYPNTDLLLRKNRLLMLVCKVNEPFYNPLTIAHCYRYYWKRPDKMPPDAHIEEDIAAMGRNLTPLGISWWGGLSPHAAGDSSPEELSRKVSGDEESVNGLLYFGRLMEQAGGHLAIVLDDIRFPLSPYDKDHHGTARVADTWFITRVMAQLKKEYPKARLLVCPPFYWGPVGRNPYNEDRDAYLKTIGEEWPPEVEVFWTGQQVNAVTLAPREYFAWWMGLTKRKPYFWQNCVAYWCHMYRRHFPTDAIDSLWQRYWDGQFDVLGWYGFNGDSIPRFCVTDAISADFQWNPQAYVKDQKASAARSVHEAAEKFIGQGAWPLLMNVTRPLGYFDNYYVERDEKQQAVLDQKAAKAYDVLEAKRTEVYTAFKVLKEQFPASVNAWSILEGFIGVADYATRINTDPNLRLYRAAAEQRAQAQKAGQFDPARDVFLAAADFDGGFLQEVSRDALAEQKLQPAMVLDGPKRRATVQFKMTAQQAAAGHEVLLHGRRNAGAGRMTLTLNGQSLFDEKAPFGELESTTVRVPVPAGLPADTNLVLSISLAAEESAPDVGVAKDDAGIGGGPPLAIHYAVVKCKERK
jgi:hypothetical protein